MLSRREFNGLCAALGSSLPAVSAMIAALSSASVLAAATGEASSGAGRTVKFRDGTIVPALGQGSGSLAGWRHPEAVEEEALRTGLSLGMTLIDTAEVYGNGRSEELIDPAAWTAAIQIDLREQFGWTSACVTLRAHSGSP